MTNAVFMETWTTYSITQPNPWMNPVQV